MLVMSQIRGWHAQTVLTAEREFAGGGMVLAIPSETRL